MRPSTHTQHANSRAVAAFATAGRLRKSQLKCLRRSTSLPTPAAAWLDIANGTDGSFNARFLSLVALVQCQAASAKSFRKWEFPALVMPPRDTCSPLECSDGTSPSRLANERAESKRENAPTSTVMANAVMVSIPFMQRSASTRPLQRGRLAYWAILFSMAFFCASMWRTSEM